MVRVTQKDIAKLAGVSQATISLVLNGSKAGSATRIPEDTRRRIEDIITQTGYVADPIARRMANGRNRILGVFTYEPAFPAAQSDFFAPFLFGIEEAAEELGHDLLLMTGAARGTHGHKRLFGQDNRLRVADGCLLLGRSMDADDLARLGTEAVPFVAIGRRDDTVAGAVPFIGADYATATQSLVAQALDLGHRAFAYLGPSAEVESQRDRWAGFNAGLGRGGRLALHVDDTEVSDDALLTAITETGATIVFMVEMADAIPVRRAAARAGLEVPRDLSIVVLGHHVRSDAPDRAFTTFDVPREEMARLATRALVARLGGETAAIQTLLPCKINPGDTLAPPTTKKDGI